MSRITTLDKRLVLTLTTIWIALFGLAVALQLEGRGTALLGLSVEGASSYPVLTGEFSVQYSSDPLARAGLRAGDRLLRVGSSDLRGVGTYGFFVRVAEVSGRSGSVPVLFERDGRRRSTSLEVIPATKVLPILVTSLAIGVSALLLVLLARPTPSVRAFYYMGMCAAIGNATQNPAAGFYLPGRGLGVLVTVGVGVACFFAFAPLLIRFLLLFPDDRPPRGWSHRVWPWFISVPSGFFLTLSYTEWISLGDLGGLVMGVALVASALGVATVKYRGAEPLARRQMKWALLGVYCAMLPIGASEVIAVLEPQLTWLTYLSFGAMAIFPLSILVSVSRFNLFDIDRILSETASFNAAGVALGACALVLVPSIAGAASAAVGVDAQTGRTALSLALLVAVVPVHRLLRPQLERVLFKERYALEHGIADTLPAFAACENAAELMRCVGERLNELVRPDGCVVYALVERSYVPVVVAGRAVPPAFEADNPLVETLTRRRKPLHLADAGRRPDQAPLGPFDRAALESLGAEVVVPVCRDAALSFFLCLGPQRSGDVYSATEISHLATVAEAAARELRRFDQEEAMQAARALHRALRSPVQGAAAPLSGGPEWAAGEREVSVLCVGLRDSAACAERREAAETGTGVEHHAESVSQVVRDHGGSVVELDGAGMIAVFGAPLDQAHKERAAVEAGREIVAALASAPAGDPDGRHRISVGVATGEAFVGSVQALDRAIWAAIGKTVHLATRLQRLTRDLEASMVIDRHTWERLEPGAADFEKRSGVAVRGRRSARDVYARSLEAELSGGREEGSES